MFYIFCFNLWVLRRRKELVALDLDIYDNLWRRDDDDGVISEVVEGKRMMKVGTNIDEFLGYNNFVTCW